MQTNEFLYSCPHCSGEVLVSQELMATEVSCPHCSAGFFATPYQPTPSVATAAQEPGKEAESQPSAGLPVKIPFFKFNRTKILSQKLDELTRDGVLDDSDSAELTALAAHLKLSVADLSDIRKKKAFAELELLRKRIEKTMWVTDGDMESFRKISRKYDLNIKFEGHMDIGRAIYLLEAKNQPPAPVGVKIPLKSNECCYLKMDTVWLQPRVQTKAYGGASVSIPSGIKGVRFRVGSVAPIRSEEITPLSEGTLYVTNKRVIFVGGSRSTTIPFGKIVEAEPFSDSVKFAKATGRPDFFSMDCAHSRLIVGLVNHFGAEGEDTD